MLYKIVGTVRTLPRVASVRTLPLGRVLFLEGYTADYTIREIDSKKSMYSAIHRTRIASRPSIAIQLYSAIHYTAIHRYTLYNLYNTPLGSPPYADTMPSESSPSRPLRALEACHGPAMPTWPMHPLALLASRDARLRGLPRFVPSPPRLPRFVVVLRSNPCDLQIGREGVLGVGGSAPCLQGGAPL